MAKGYPVDFPDGCPAFEKRSTILEQVAASIIQEKDLEKPKVQRKPAVEVSGTITDLQSFFSQEIVLEKISNMLNGSIN